MRGRHLGGGWRVIDGCRLSPDGPPVEIMLVHRELGLAIMELEPRWTPGAEQLLQDRLKAAGFADRFPGHLPIIHRRLRREVLTELPMVLTEAFSWQDPLTISAELDWIEGLREALGATDADAPTRGPVPVAVVEEAPAAAVEEPRRAADPVTHLVPAPSEPAPPTAHAPPLAALAGAMGKPSAPPIAANVPEKTVGVAGLARGRRTGLTVGGSALAAGIALVIALGRLPPSETPPTEARVQVAAATGAAAPMLTPLAGATPVSAAPTAAEVAPAQPVAASPEPIAPFAEPEAPRLEGAEAVLAAQLPPEPIAPFAESEAPRLEQAEAVLAAQLPPEPIAPFAEPEAPRLEQAEAVLAAQLAPEPIAPFPEPEAPRLEAAEAVLAAQLAPEPIAPFAEPEAPRLEAAEAVLAAQLAPVAAPAAPAAVAVPPTPAAAMPPALSMAPEMVETLLRRGSELMRIGDVSAARRFFERAAAGGSGQAALEAGATYDPRELQRIGARGIPPDRNAALTWYRRAAAMGAAEAQDRIRALEATP